MTDRGRSRAYGQNFLVSPGVCDAIADAFLEQSPPDSLMLEIGPGEGALTTRLPRPITVAELDPLLSAKWKAEPDVEVLEGNAIETVPRWLKDKDSVSVVANLPYNASTAILSMLLAQAKKIPLMVLMFQREVATKIRSQPGERDVGPISLLAQSRYKVSRLMSVSPGSFRPRPNVDSEVLVFERLDFPLVPDEAWARLEELGFKAFQHRRKMLKHNIPDAPARLLSLRAHELAWQDWITLLESKTE